jgi:hypothetical protein
MRLRGSGAATRSTTFAVTGSTRSSDPLALPTQTPSRSATTASGPSGTATRPVTLRAAAVHPEQGPGWPDTIFEPAAGHPDGVCLSATPTGPYSSWPRSTRPRTRLVLRSTRHSSRDRSWGIQAVVADNPSPPRSAFGGPTGTLTTTWLVAGSMWCRLASLTTTHSPSAVARCGRAIWSGGSGLAGWPARPPTAAPRRRSTR